MKNKERKTLYDLVIWSDNPRHGLQVEDSDSLSERDIINILIDVVGKDKMYNLAEDIFTEHGLMGNVLPTVVEKDGLFYVYDGNRRISCIKILKNPDLIDDRDLRKKISTLVQNTDLSFLDNIDVYITNEEEALKLMDKTHGNAKQGVGVIPWDAYQRDTSLAKRSKPTKYPNAFKVASILEVKKKSDFLIPYTNLDRLFGSKLLKETFEIMDLDLTHKKNITEALTELLLYKEEKSFKSFSREFNIIDAGKEEDSTKPIRRFCDWYLERKMGKAEFTISANNVKIFEDENFDPSLFEVNVESKITGKINFDQEDLYYKYITPYGKNVEKIDLKIIGPWGVKIGYKGVDIEKTVSVQQLQDSDIMFDEKKMTIVYGSSIALGDVIIRALDSHRKDMKNSLNCVNIDNANIVNGIFMPDNPEGTYDISFQFDNMGKTEAHTKTFTITKKLNPAKGVNLSEPLIVYSTDVNINISPFVNKIVNEINKTDLNSFPCLITSSLRSLVELSLLRLQELGIINLNPTDLKSNIDSLKKIFKGNQSKIDAMCLKFSYCNSNDIKNFFKQLDSDSLAGTLNLGAHKNQLNIDLVNLKEKCQKTISGLIIYINALVNL
jgi:hypothetical protein